MDFRYGGRRSGGESKSRFGGSGFASKDVRYENGGGGGGGVRQKPAERQSMRSGGWSGPPGLRSDGGNYASGAGGPDWWDS